MVTAIASLTRSTPSRARRSGAKAALVLLALAAAWPAVLLNASGAERDAAERDAAPLLASLDSLSRRPHVAWTAKRRLEGELVDKRERGWMDVVTRFDPSRGVSHQILAEGGSDRIRKRALASVLDKEVETANQEEARRAAFSRDNYRFRVLDAIWNDVRVELEPLRDDVRLLNGQATLDARSGDLRKVEGQLSRNPSFWVRDVFVSRKYARVGGATLPVELVSTARVRMFGNARLHIRTEYTSVDGRPVGAEGSTQTATLASYE